MLILLHFKGNRFPLYQMSVAPQLGGWVFCLLFVVILGQGFSMKSWLSWNYVNYVDLEITKMLLSLPPVRWD